jgi:hypothetical protein
MQGPSWDPGETRLILRYLALRKRRAVGIILAECGVYYRCESPEDPWGTKVRISVEEFGCLLDRAETPSKGMALQGAGNAVALCA